MSLTAHSAIKFQSKRLCVRNVIREWLYQPKTILKLLFARENISNNNQKPVHHSYHVMSSLNNRNQFFQSLIDYMYDKTPNNFRNLLPAAYWRTTKSRPLSSNDGIWNNFNKLRLHMFQNSHQWRNATPKRINVYRNTVNDVYKLSKPRFKTIYTCRTQSQSPVQNARSRFVTHQNLGLLSAVHEDATLQITACWDTKLKSMNSFIETTIYTDIPFLPESVAKNTVALDKSFKRCALKAKERTRLQPIYNMVNEFISRRSLRHLRQHCSLSRIFR